MSFKLFLILLLVFAIAGISVFYSFFPSYARENPRYIIKNKQQIISLFPTTPEDIKKMVTDAKQEAQQAVQRIVAVPDDQRTFENTALALDRATAFNFSIPGHIASAVAFVDSDDALRDAAHKAQVELSHFGVDLFSQNVELYNAFKAYVDGNANKEELTEKQRYFLKETMDEFKRAGLHLPQEKRENIKKLIKELAQLGVDFERNINTSQRSITVERKDLAGLDDDFINRLEKTDDGRFILTTDYPTYFPVMEHCTVTETRKKLYDAFNNRAYPENIAIINDIIAKRDALAKELGYESFAALNIDDQMAKNPETVRTFLDELVKRAKVKAEQEVEQLKSDLPASVSLVDGQFQPWDLGFARSAYKKEHYQFDERDIQPYFPMEKTIDGLLQIYEKFFDITLKEEPIQGLWDDEVRFITVYKKDSTEPLGYLLLDLYPRKNKYSHACELTIVPGVERKEGFIPPVALVIANFTKSTATKPSLLKLSEVRTFFHEFGHAIHELLGATQLASFSGTQVKLDFVEMPSQMLEEWLWDPHILKNLSSHYKTGDSLPDHYIEKVLALKNFSIGHWVLGQSLYSLISLNYFAPGKQKDILQIMNNLKKELLPFVARYEHDHMPASFGHLFPYGARYYGYLWSKVFALDLFAHIKKFGLLNPKIGKEYAKKVLSQGGSKDPNELLENFLGRQPTQEAFFKDLGL